MAYFDAATLSALAQRTVRLSPLVFFDFVGDPRRYGFQSGPLRTADGQEWEGTGGVGSISGLATPIGTTAPVVTFQMSGVDARVAALARAASSTVKGRGVTVFLQVFTEDWGLLGSPISLWDGELDLMRYRAEGGGQYTVSVTAETAWTKRSKPPFGFLTDTDQKARFPGDRGLEQVSSLIGKTINWPS